MTFDVEKWSRRLWHVNGVLLFLLCLALLGSVGYVLIDELWESNDFGVRAPGPTGPMTDSAVTRARAVRYGSPQQVFGTTVRLVKVRYGKGFAEEGGPSFTAGGAMSYSRRYDGSGPTVNVMFLPVNGPGRLLLDRAAYIHEMNFPHPRTRWEDEETDSLPVITYEIAFEDTDQSGSLDSDDDRGLYVSELDGTQFRGILPAGYRFVAASWAGHGRLLVTALDGRGLDGTEVGRFPQRAFVYDVTTRVLTPEPSLDSLSTLAGRIVGERVRDGGGRPR